MASIRRVLISAKDSTTGGHTDGEESKYDEKAHSSSKARLAVLGFNLCIMYFLCLMAVLHRDKLHFFSFGWTTRSSADSAGTVGDLYIANNVSTTSGLNILKAGVFAAAMCQPISFNNEIQWSEKSVSPTCNCIYRKHLDYVKMVSDSIASTNAMPGLTAVTAFKTTLINDCFGKLRTTQVETMHDPENSFYSTNLVACAVAWNIMSTMWSFYVYMDQMKKYGVSSGFFWALLVFFVIIIHIPVAIIFISGNIRMASLIGSVVILNGIFVIFHLYYEHSGAGTWPFRKSLLFWVKYTVCLSMASCIFNVITQRRLDVINMTSIAVSVCLGLSSLVTDYCRDSVQLKTSLSFEKAVDYIWISNMVIAFMVYNSSVPAFVQTSFSNVYNAAWVSLLSYLMAMVMQNRGVFKLLSGGDKDNMALANQRMEHSLTWFRTSLDVVARFMLSTALIFDITGMAYLDAVMG